MEPQTEEQASKDEEFDVWSFQAHERGVRETIKKTIADLNLWKEKGSLSKKQSQSQKDLRSNTFRGTTRSPGWKEYLSQKKSNSSGTIARLQVCISGLIFLLLLKYCNPLDFINARNK